MKQMFEQSEESRATSMCSCKGYTDHCPEIYWAKSDILNEAQRYTCACMLAVYTPIIMWDRFREKGSNACFFKI